MIIENFKTSSLFPFIGSFIKITFLELISSIPKYSIKQGILLKTTMVTFTIRYFLQKIGIEETFSKSMPTLNQISVIKSKVKKIHKAKLYYLRNNRSK